MKISVILLLVSLSVASILLALAFGSVSISASEILSCFTEQCANNSQQLILMQLRLPRVLVGFVAGMGLSMVGALLQNTTRNPLADPYLFGIVAGAGLGATLYTLLPIQAMLLPLAAFIGALLAIILVFSSAKLLQQLEHLILTGVAVSFMLSAITQFLLYMAEPLASNRVMFWLMGSLARVNINQFYLIAAAIIIGFIVVFAFRRQLDALSLGDDNAAFLGINVTRLRMLIFLLCALITAVIVAYCGGIAFVGLMVPHIVRYFVGNKILPLMLASALTGGSFLVWVDVIARTSFTGMEIPLGIITSAIGSVFFLMLIALKRNAANK